MFGLFVLIFAFVVFAALSARFGVDSRIDPTDEHRSDHRVSIS